MTELRFPHTETAPETGPSLYEIDGTARIISTEKACGLAARVLFRGFEYRSYVAVPAS